MVADVWNGTDYIPEVFDEWIADPTSFFQAGELNGEVVAIQRLRPIAEGIVYYGGLRVASSHRRRGVGRAMLRAAITQGREVGFQEVRLATGVDEARGLFESEGFRLILQTKIWRATRLEGGDPPSLLQPGQAATAFEGLRAGPDLEAYAGLLPDPERPVALDGAELSGLIDAGWVRAGAGGQAIAVAGPMWHVWMVLFAAGRGVALQDLLMAIRFEADAEGRDVRLVAPDPHPAEGDIEAAGFEFRRQAAPFYFYSLLLS